MTVHVASEHPSLDLDDERARCLICGFETRDRNLMRAHREVNHGGARMPSKPASMPKSRPTKKQKISAVGAKPGGDLACPKCGGAQFKTRRSALHRTTIITTVGVSGLLKSGSQVRCTTCGTIYKRG
jgi:hypothetical protein